MCGLQNVAVSGNEPPAIPDWSELCAGPPGPAGVTGPTGPTGPIGPTGPTGLINANTSYYVATSGSDTTGNGTSGSPWATLAHALSIIGAYHQNPNVTVTIFLGDGTYSSTTPINLAFSGDLNLVIQGTNAYPKSMTSVQSSSGSVSSYSVIINVADVNNVAVGDYVTIPSAANGTYPDRICGCHQITNVDATNLRLTLAVKGFWSTPPSGTVTATVTVVKTLLSFTGCNGFTTSNTGAVTLGNLVVVGNRTSGTYGIYGVLGSCIVCNSNVGVSGFDFGILSSFYSYISLGGTCASYNLSYGIVIQCAVGGGSFVVSGNYYGFAAWYGAAFNGSNCVAVGSASHGVYAYGSAVQMSGAATHITANGGSGVYSDAQSTMWILSVQLTYNGAFGIAAYDYSYVIATGAYFTGNTSGNCTPAADTQGNNYAYIQV